ncbi:hypothetical protein, partial [Enterobacter hormaechei]
MRTSLLILPLAGLLAQAPAFAQDMRDVPDPAAIQIPDLSGGRDPAVVSNGWKYFYYWRADTSFAE